MAALPLLGLIEPPVRPALARAASLMDSTCDIDAPVARLRIAARAVADTSRAKSMERPYGNNRLDFCAFARLIRPVAAGPTPAPRVRRANRGVDLRTTRVRPQRGVHHIRNGVAHRCRRDNPGAFVTLPPCRRRRHPRGDFRIARLPSNQSCNGASLADGGAAHRVVRDRFGTRHGLGEAA